MIKRQKEADISDVYGVREQIISTTRSGIRRFRFITSLTYVFKQFLQWT